MINLSRAILRILIYKIKTTYFSSFNGLLHNLQELTRKKNQVFFLSLVFYLLAPDDVHTNYRYKIKLNFHTFLDLQHRTLRLHEVFRLPSSTQSPIQYSIKTLAFTFHPNALVTFLFSLYIITSSVISQEIFL